MFMRQFHNGLRVLLNLDRDELVQAGVIAPGDDDAWYEFAGCPFRWFIRAPDEKAGRLWQLMQRRMVR